MKASSVDIKKSQIVTLNFLVKGLCEKYGWTENVSICELSKTMVYRLLLDEETEMYSESPECIMDMLLEELEQSVISVEGVKINLEMLKQNSKKINTMADIQ